MHWRSAFLSAALVLVSAHIVDAQSEHGNKSDVRNGSANGENENARSEQELAGRAVELRKAQEAEDRQSQTVEALARELETAKQSGDASSAASAEAKLLEAQQLLTRLAQQTATAQKLVAQAKEKLDIAKKKQELAAAKGEPNSGGGEKSKAPFEDVLNRRMRVEQATHEAELAQKQTRTLRDQLQTMLARQKELRATSDELGLRLNARDIPSTERERLWNERQEYIEAARRTTEEIQHVREEILLAEATQLIKEEAADEALLAYDRWTTSLVLSGFLLGAALLLVIAARVVLARFVREPERRYTVNKLFSLATTLIVVFGMIFIFAEQFSSLLTLFGFAVAGLAIALQEVIASLAAWFFIRGSRGYATGDWVQIGTEFGEVVDITFLRTTIEQFQPLSTDGKPGGANPTGGLIVLMNNAVFKHTLVNYTRGYPFVWCSLVYNVPFESNWERARDVLYDAMLAEPEIVDTARRAKKNIGEMASSYHIRIGSTEPVVRTWVSGVGVELTLRFLAHPRSRPVLLDIVNLRILRAIQQTDDIRFAYWTVRSIATPPKEEGETVNAESNRDDRPDIAQPSVQHETQDVRKAG